MTNNRKATTYELYTPATKERLLGRNSIPIWETKRFRFSAIAAYVIVGFLNFGWHINHPAPGETWSLADGSVDTFRRDTNAAALIPAWPIYWLGVGAIQITRWP